MAGRILIVDDIATNRMVLKVILSSALYETLQATNGDDAIALAQQMQPDLIILDVDLAGINGIEMCGRLKANPLTRDIPVVMIAAQKDHARKIKSLRAGAAEVFAKPIDDSLLLARLRSLLRARETERELGCRLAQGTLPGLAEGAAGFVAQAHVAIVAALPNSVQSLHRDLSRATSDHISLMAEEAAIGLAAENRVPDVFLVVTDAGRPERTLRLISDLRSRPATRKSALCAVVPAGSGALGAIALDLGADDLVELPAEATELALRLSSLVRRKRQGDRMRISIADGLRLSVLDPLTGLHNRRYAMPQLHRIREHARQSGRDYAVMVLDIDRFKTINDTFGHAAGDTVLVQIAERLRANLRPGDTLARIGGEEFVVASADTPLPAARALAERIRHAIEERPFALTDGRSIGVTLSVGLAIGAAGAGPSVDVLLESADRALFKSKSEGRNQVTVHRTAA
ncbi:diguanylate cyclase [Defluviimonas sp. WL0002]|uniref:diguanylate cyclase n=1 Tax=Albidovulum marisflavi TaxID=2984159 RepID=A0ABT2ZCG9_9RHOB|nr:diguanylate cyclase [Defluviimonas sp. WL0002]MCV2868791.1 diguanylate cyclase [Defluviimonas sp. WL0002]